MPQAEWIPSGHKNFVLRAGEEILASISPAERNASLLRFRASVRIGRGIFRDSYRDTIEECARWIVSELGCQIAATTAPKLEKIGKMPLTRLPMPPIAKPDPTVVRRTEDGARIVPLRPEQEYTAYQLWRPSLPIHGTRHDTLQAARQHASNFGQETHILGRFKDDSDRTVFSIVETVKPYGAPPSRSFSVSYYRWTSAELYAGKEPGETGFILSCCTLREAIKACGWFDEAFEVIGSPPEYIDNSYYSKGREEEIFHGFYQARRLHIPDGVTPSSCRRIGRLFISET